MIKVLNKSSKSKQAVQIVLSLLLLTVGSGLLWLGSAIPSKTAKAQTGDQKYITRWSATKLLTLKDFRALKSQAGPFDIGMEIAVGPSEWVVSETPETTGLPWFGETWTAPMTNLPIVNGDWVSDDIVSDILNYGPKWLVGFTRAKNLVNRTYRFSFDSKPTSSFISNASGLSSYSTAKVWNGGQGAICTKDFATQTDGGNRCLYSTGSYGFIEHHAYDDGDEGRPAFAGIVMPLYWEVKGKICYTNPGANGCRY